MKVSNKFSPLLTHLQHNNTNKKSSFKTLSSSKVPKQKVGIGENGGGTEAAEKKTD
jgi:hypothetical protein